MSTAVAATIPASGEELRVRRIPRIILWTTGFLFITGIAAAIAWSITGDNRWVRSFFTYPGSLYLLGCGCLQLWFSFRCWQQFSPGDSLRPAWLFISAAAALQLIGGFLTQWLGIASGINPIVLLPVALRESLRRGALTWGELFSPLYMVLLACGLFFVLRACRQIGVLHKLTTVDFALFGVVVLYTVLFFATVVFSPEHGGRTIGLHAIISWASDPLLCVLLVEAILIRRSAANLGWGLVSRCWMCFTAAIFLTSVGDIGLWAWSKGYLTRYLQVASWHVWFLASAAYVLGPAYQYQAMLRAVRGHLGDEMDSGWAEHGPEELSGGSL